MTFDMNKNTRMLSVKELLLGLGRDPRTVTAPPGLHVPVPEAHPGHKAFTPVWPIYKQCSAHHH